MILQCSKPLQTRDRPLDPQYQFLTILDTFESTDFDYPGLNQLPAPFGSGNRLVWLSKIRNALYQYFRFVAN